MVRRVWGVGKVCSGWRGGPGEQQLALSRGPGEGAGEEVSIAALLQRLPDTRSGGGGVQTIKKEQEAGIHDVEEDQTGVRALMVPVQNQCSPTFCLLTDHLSSPNTIIIMPDNVGVSHSVSQAERDDRGGHLL